MFGGLLSLSGFLILKLVYGKKSAELQNEYWFRYVSLLVSLGFIFWAMSVLFLIGGISSDDKWLCVGYGIAFPLTFIVWGIIERKKTN